MSAWFKRNAPGAEVLITVLCLGGCAATTTPEPGVAQSLSISNDGGVMVARPELTFFDADAFDVSLGQTFADKPSAVRVAFAAPTSLNAIPPRINVWLTEIKKSDGRIRMAPADPNGSAGTRGLGIGMIFDLIDVIITIQERQARARQLSGARAYDATIIYDKTTGTAKEVLFQRRGA